MYVVRTERGNSLQLIFDLFKFDLFKNVRRDFPKIEPGDIKIRMFIGEDNRETFGLVFSSEHLNVPDYYRKKIKKESYF
jgi:hypothetical protein